MTEIPEPYSRRNWLLYSLATGVATTAGAVFYPVIRFLWPRAATQSGALEVIAPFNVGQLPNAPSNPFDFGGKPCLVILTPDGEKRRDRKEALRPDDVRAFNAVCTHVDCTVAYRKDKGDIFCNCHNGRYNLNGQNVSGPPPRPLEKYKVTLTGEAGQEEIIVSRTT